MLFPRSRLLAWLAVLAIVPFGQHSWAAEPACTNPDPLGVSRVQEVDTATGPIFGDIQYTRAPTFLRDKEVVLTFDDGPFPETTPAILSALAEQCTKATFFYVGKMALKNPDILALVDAAGETIGAHTWSHADLRKLPTPAAQVEIERSISMLQLRLGHPIAPFFRFPYLSDPKSAIRYLGGRNIATFSADVDSWDSHGLTPSARIVNYVMTRLKEQGHGIVLMHDIKHTTAAALPEILRQLKAGGWKIVHMVPKAPARSLAAYDKWASQTIDTNDKAPVLVAEVKSDSKKGSLHKLTKVALATSDKRQLDKPQATAQLASTKPELASPEPVSLPVQSASNQPPAGPVAPGLKASVPAPGPAVALAASATKPVVVASNEPVAVPVLLKPIGTAPVALTTLAATAAAATAPVALTPRNSFSPGKAADGLASAQSAPAAPSPSAATSDNTDGRDVPPGVVAPQIASNSAIAAPPANKAVVAVNASETIAPGPAGTAKASTPRFEVAGNEPLPVQPAVAALAAPALASTSNTHSAGVQPDVTAKVSASALVLRRAASAAAASEPQMVSAGARTEPRTEPAGPHQLVSAVGLAAPIAPGLASSKSTATALAASAVRLDEAKPGIQPPIATNVAKVEANRANGMDGAIHQATSDQPVRTALADPDPTAALVRKHANQDLVIASAEPLPSTSVANAVVAAAKEPVPAPAVEADTTAKAQAAAEAQDAAKARAQTAAAAARAARLLRKRQLAEAEAASAAAVAAKTSAAGPVEPSPAPVPAPARVAALVVPPKLPVPVIKPAVPAKLETQQASLAPAGVLDTPPTPKKKALKPLKLAKRSQEWLTTISSTDGAFTNVPLSKK